MRIRSRVAAGSPALRLAATLLLVMLLAILATGTIVTGASLLSTPAIVVAQDGSGTVKTITEAVAAAQDGDVVLVKPGTYRESIAITEDITLRGDGDPGAVVIEFASDGPTHVLAEDGTFVFGILLEGGDARLQNLTVRGPAEGVAVVIDGGAPVIKGVDVVLEAAPDEPYYKRSAFRVQGGAAPVIRDGDWDAYVRVSGAGSSATFEGNRITAQIIAIGASGAKAVIVNNTFRDDAGILLAEYGSSAIVEDNDIEGSIGGYVGADSIIRGNRIRTGYQAGPGERGSAIQLTGAGAALVEGNVISDAQYGIDVSALGGSPRISGNTISGSTIAAISVASGDPVVDGNAIEGNATGIEVLGRGTPALTNNRFCDNGTDLVVPEGSDLTLDGNTVCASAASTAP